MPEVNISDVVSRLSSKDYDTQASQMAEIIKVMLDSPEKLNQYVVKDVFVNLINIAEKNTDNLAKPTEEQGFYRMKVRDILSKQSTTENIHCPICSDTNIIQNALRICNCKI